MNGGSEKSIASSMVFVEAANPHFKPMLLVAVEDYVAGLSYPCVPARDGPGPGNGPIWQREPSDRNSIWRRGYYRGNDPDNRIRQQLMRHK
jgi:hypothetical protein